jgi:ectoine hydroxylase-related dioxygenase (phytanoyl-CoA dioxygenase family)
MSTLLTDTPAEIRAFYETQGYYIARGLFSPAEVHELEVDFDRIVDQLVASHEDINARWGGPEVDRIGAADTLVLHTHNVQKYSAAWLRAMLHPKFLAAANAILGPDVILHHSKLFQKPAERGAPFPMHQDWNYFPTVNDTMMAGIIHISAATDAMGCFRVYPGTHKLGRIADTSGAHENELLAKYPLEGATALEAEPGDVVFFHYFLIHGSMPNRSDSIRKTVLVQLHAGSDRVEDQITHPNERLVLSGWNYHSTRNRAGQSD